MKILFPLCLLLALSVPANSTAGPIVVGGGAGSGEFYLYYSLRVFPMLIKACAVSPTCSKELESALAEIASIGPSEKTSIKIVTSSALGNDLYRRSTDGLILINQDKLFTERDGKLQPWSSRETIAFFLSVWSTDLAISKADATLLATRLADLAELRRERTASSELDLVNFSLVKIAYPISSIAIEDNSGAPQAVSIEIPLGERLSCADSTGLPSDMSLLESLDIKAARWGAANRHQGVNTVLLQVLGFISYTCRTGNQSTHYSSRFRVEIRAVKTNEIYSVDPTQISVQQIEIVETPEPN